MSVKSSDLVIFTLDASHAYGITVARELDLELSPHEERTFEDGEHKCRPLTNVRGKDVYVLHSLYGDAQQSVNDKLMRMLALLGAARDAGAERVTAVAPLLCYMRKDRKSQPRDPVMTRYIASLFESVGIDRIVTVEVHNLAAYQNAFRCRTEHLDAGPLFVEHLISEFPGEALAVVSPDAGGMKRAERFRKRLSDVAGQTVSSAFAEKYRAGGVVSGEAFVGDVQGKVAIIYDDLIASGTTMVRAAQACFDHGAKAVCAAATHGLFVGDASRVLGGSPLAQVIVTDTVPPFRLNEEAARRKLRILSTAALVARAIATLHANGSLLEIGEDE